ncbi:MAG: dTMP kinase [Candidatus Eremiobacteraeota bacterium]|nr:dTMP kinase [Candidatus Eremiobacteraeota bacterium]
MFISVEGIEGSGKSTLLDGIQHALETDGHRIVRVREPGGTPAGDRVRELFLDAALGKVDPLAEMMLINASRAQLTQDVIRPALAKGFVVLCDRYVHSSLAYQGFGRGIPLETVREVCRIATNGLMPDLTIFVDVSVETSMERVAQRGKPDRLDRESAAFHQRVRDGYRRLALTDDRIVTVDGELDADAVLDAALAAVAVIA